MTTQAQIERDYLLAFLIAAHKDGSAGRSATALIISAFTGQDPDEWPHDAADLARCETAYAAAPLHLQMFMGSWLDRFRAHVSGRGGS